MLQSIGLLRTLVYTPAIFALTTICSNAALASPMETRRICISLWPHASRFGWIGTGKIVMSFSIQFFPRKKIEWGSFTCYPGYWYRGIISTTRLLRTRPGFGIGIPMGPSGDRPFATMVNTDYAKSCWTTVARQPPARFKPSSAEFLLQVIWRQRVLSTMPSQPYVKYWWTTMDRQAQGKFCP